MRLNKWFCTAVFAVLIMTSAADAEPLTLTIPGTGWYIAFDAPSLTKFQGQAAESGFQYQAASASGFNISIFVEEKGGEDSGNKACSDFYWPLAKRNPMIDQSTVTTRTEKDFVVVSYRVRGEQKGVKFDIPNVNLYFEYQGKWVDVHISKYPFEDADQQVLDDFVNSLRYAMASK
jgi:hypothetical protein